MARTATKGLEYYEYVAEKINEGESAKTAIESAAENFGTNPANIQTAYYRIRRQRGEAAPPKVSTMSRAPRTLPVPEDLENILPMLRAGIAAFEKTLEWVSAKEAELREREATIAAREDEAKKKILAQLDSLFA